MEPVVSLRSAVVLLGGFPALAGVDLDVGPGERLLVRGANGAGKTSLLRVCAGVARLDRGRGTVLGADLDTDATAVRRGVGLLTHDAGLYDDLTLGENLAFWSAALPSAHDAAVDAASAVGLDRRLLTVPARGLSAGQRRRAGLALLVVRRPHLWLLDEPHAGLDAEGRDLVDSLLVAAGDAGATVVFSSHDLDRADAVATRSIELVGGIVADAPPADARPADARPAEPSGAEPSAAALRTSASPTVATLAARQRPEPAAAVASRATPPQPVGERLVAEGDRRPAWWRDAATVAGKDLLVERRTLVAGRQVLPFALTVLVLFGLALDADRPTLERASTGVMWMTVMFSTVLLTQRSVSIDAPAGIAERLRLSGLSPAGVYLGKTISIWVQIASLTALLVVGVVVIYDVGYSGWPLLVVSGCAATVAIAAAGALYGSIAAGSGGRETLLSLLLLPVLAPVLLSVTRAWEVASGRGIGDGWPWAGMLVVTAVMYLSAGSLSWRSLMEDR